MVFQSFCLFALVDWCKRTPNWTTVRGVSERGSMKRKWHSRLAWSDWERALCCSHPKELSGGMRQRVGFARAFVMKADVLMMDEPFSALDVLTAENLRGEISDLGSAERFRRRAFWS